jgi:hypothetical protein
MDLVQMPRLELSGPKLRLALETLVSRAEEHGGVEAYVDALKLKSALFASALASELGLQAFRTLCAHMATVRRRIGRYVEPEAYAKEMQPRLARLLESREDVSGAEQRIKAFCGAFPDDRAHRWVRDLAAELLHYGDSERYPLMGRWVWDARTNTGVIREIWHGEDVDGTRIEVPDGYPTFLALREELAQYLSANGVFRDVLYYIDLLTAQVYANYIGERGGLYLRTDFSTPEDPMVHTRRILGLDGVDAKGRSRLKASDGRAVILSEH